MSFFLIGFAAMIALALALLLPSLLRRGAASPVQTVDARRANVQVLREQLAAAAAEHAAGTLDADQYGLTRTEIERRVLEEETVPDQAPVAASAGKTAIVLGATLPLFAFVVYGLIGDPEAMLPRSVQLSAPGSGEVTMPQIEAMVEKLAQRLENQTTPQEGDAQAWTMLARSYAVLQRYPEASRAYGRARALDPENAQLLADHADVMAMLQGQSVAGEPAKLVERALQLDPRNLKALALAGSAAFERKDYRGALNHWGQALPLAQPGSDFANGLESSMQQARAAAGQTAAGGNAVASTPAPTQKPTITAGAAQVSGVVQLSAALAAKAAPTDTVFVFARAAEGPRMPLAILKRKVSELPLNFTLDDSSAMSPALSLSKFPNVMVGARISRSGEAMPRSGDLIGQAGPVPVGTGKLLITIDGVQP